MLTRMVTILSTLFAFSSLGFCQQAAHHSAAGLAGERLIAWSELQKPQPVPQAIPEQIHPLTKTLTGTVSNKRGFYTLETTDSSEYVIDNSQQVLEHLGIRVQIVGALDAKTGRLHVLSIAGL